ncbi:unnamed protein product [Cyberlindnera jadinii]|uniref:Uncharacterized protein n=1 Tax=Cyberlindnera jadinii (strain ATCC 18201 / CBS 1600 / BCRC 20928 / JCM 3617 / NBRC 0987 / NRRL Y-1542) TaxID=983966 RepID=A0A0H5CBL6_CYBJN|nr:unnamed protein product [Cyberlindnera jadinii]
MPRVHVGFNTFHQWSFSQIQAKEGRQEKKKENFRVTGPCDRECVATAVSVEAHNGVIGRGRGGGGGGGA